MAPELIAAIASVVVIVITVTGQWINSRNDRSLTSQDVDIWKKLDPDSKAARDLIHVIEFRIAKWRERIGSARLRRSGYSWGFAGAFWLLLAIAAYATDTQGWVVGPLLLAVASFGYMVEKFKQSLSEQRREQP
jgi:hypothetical protein